MQTTPGTPAGDAAPWHHGPVITPATTPDGLVVPPPPPPEVPPAVLAAQAFAQVTPGSTVHGSTVRGPAGLTVDCVVAGIERTGDVFTAHVGLWLAGKPVGPAPVLATVDGYGDTPDAAVVEGAGRWAAQLGPVLVAAATGLPHPGVQQTELTVDSRRFHLAMARMDRGVGDAPEAARARFGGQPWLTSPVLRAATMPMLTTPHSTVLAITVNDAEVGRAVRVTVHGKDWWPSALGLATAPPAPSGSTVLLEELAVLTPASPQPTVTRAFLERTVAGLAYAHAPGETAGWPGWWAHAGVVGPALSRTDAEHLEAFAGRLPPDYWEFLTSVTGSGAGPGYGLLAPEVRSGAIPLAHAGCGAVWVLRLDEPFRGQVWVDVPGPSGAFQPVARSFTRWWADWLDGAVRGAGPWVQWPASACVGSGVVARAVLARAPVPDGELLIASPGGFFPAHMPLDPCQACVAAASSGGLAPSVFAPGALSRKA